jgi:hypothetical protein
VLKKFFLFVTVCLFTFFGFYGNASATSGDYICKAENLGYTTEKIKIEFSYHESDDRIVQNLYINIAKLEGGEPQIWDALYSTDADFNYWATPLLRDIAIGTSPLIIVQESGISPGHERLKADFYNKTYPVECTVRS